MSSIIEEKCIKKGVRLTDQRRLVAKIMSESVDHPDVDELHKRVSKLDSKISIATVIELLNYLKNPELLKNMTLKEIKQDTKSHQLNTTTI